MSIFRRSKSKSQLHHPTSSSPAPPLPPAKTASTSKPQRRTSNQSLTTKHVDDFGRVIERPIPAFGHEGSPLIGYDPYSDPYGAEDGEPKEFALLYGYTPLETQLELSVERVGEIVELCAEQIRTRGLDTPLILSSMALDLSLEGSCSLIRAYLSDPQGWAYDLNLAAPLSVGAHLKWGLGRLVNDRGGRGFISWDSYYSFKQAEHESNYPSRFISTHLIARLPSPSARLLSTLLSLFSSISAHSSTNGMPPRKLASLFGPLLFGLADDQPFDQTYQEWQRTTDATEHLILAFVRDQQAQVGQLPTKLARFVADYPAHLNVGYGAHEAPRVARGARVEEVLRVRRLTRFHSRNLVQSAGTWEVPGGREWGLFFPPGGGQAGSNALSTSNGAAGQVLPTYTAYYKHLLNIRHNPLLDDDDDLGEMQRYKTVVEKEWSMFGEQGFKDDLASKLEFDLTEGERAPKEIKRQTLDWSTFTDSGFGGRETFAPTDLIFHQTISAKVRDGPTQAQATAARLRAIEAALPPFPYDTTAKEEGRILVDALFFEAWADILVSGGWARDELKESSFALLHWKAQAAQRGERDVRGTDGGRWVLCEEIVPAEYRNALVEGRNASKKSKRVSFMRVVRRGTTAGKKSSTMPAIEQRPTSPSSGAGGGHNSGAYSTLAARPVDEAVFSQGWAGPTKQVSLSANLRSTNNSFVYVPSIGPSMVSSAGAMHGHGGAESYYEGRGDRRASQDTVSTIQPAAPSPEPYYNTNPAPRAPIPGTMPSAQGLPVHSPAPSPLPPPVPVPVPTQPVSREPVGYTKPSTKTGGFLARLGAGRKSSKGPQANASGLAAIEGSPQMGEEDGFSPTSPDAEMMPSAVELTDHQVQAGANGNGNGYGNGVDPRGVGPVQYGSYRVDSPDQHVQPQAQQTPTPMVTAPNSLRDERRTSGPPPAIPAKSEARLAPGTAAPAAVDPRVSAYSNTSSLGTASPYTDSGVSSEGQYEDEDVATMIGQVMFRGSQQYAMPSRLNSVDMGAPGTSASGANGEGRGEGYVRPARNASLLASPIAESNVALDDGSHMRLGYASGATTATNRVSRIVGMYEQRGDSDNGHY